MGRLCVKILERIGSFFIYFAEKYLVKTSLLYYTDKEMPNIRGIGVLKALGKGRRRTDGNI